MEIHPPPIDPINITHHRPKRRPYAKAWLVMLLALLGFILLAFV